MTPDDIIRLMEEVGPVTEDIKNDVRTLPKNVIRDTILMSSGIMASETIEQLEKVAAALKLIDKHLTKKEHPPESECWQARATTVSLIHQLKNLLDQIEKLQMAARQFADENPPN